MGTYNPFSLCGKTILVTGASSGIGKAIATEASRMGGRIVITARNEERLCDTLKKLEGTGHSMIISDLTDPESLDKLIKNIPELDGVVLCAGQGLTVPMAFSTRQKLDKVFEINFFSQVELQRLLLKKKLIKKGGSIVMIDSVGGIKKFSPANGVYGASKAALLSWSKFSAIELASKQIRVNAICPGMVETPLINPATLSQEQLDKYRATYPLGRFGKPEEIGYAAIYLLSDASAWVTGTQIVIDGGSTI